MIISKFPFFDSDKLPIISEIPIYRLSIIFHRYIAHPYLEEKENEIVEVLLVEKDHLKEEEIGFSMFEEDGLEPDDSAESDINEPSEKVEDLKDKIRELSEKDKKREISTGKKKVEEAEIETTPRAYDELLNRINDKLIEMAKNRS